MRSDFVLQLLVATDGHALTWIKGVVRATMRKEQRQAYIAFADVCIVFAKCSCPAGLSGCCVHISATLWALNKLGQNRGSSTSRPCAWNIPAKKKEPTKVQELHIERHDPAKQEKRQRQPLHRFDPRPVCTRTTTSGRFQTLCQRVAAIDIESGSQPSNISALYGPAMLSESSDTDINAESPLDAIIDASRSDILACSFDYVHVHTSCSDRLARHMTISQERRIAIAAQMIVFHFSKVLWSGGKRKNWTCSPSPLVKVVLLHPVTKQRIALPHTMPTGSCFNQLWLEPLTSTKAHSVVLSLWLPKSHSNVHNTPHSHTTNNIGPYMRFIATYLEICREQSLDPGQLKLH